MIDPSGQGKLRIAFIFRTFEFAMEVTLIIIPTFNERDNISPLVDSIFLNFPQGNILFVDDSSPDGTALEINLLQKKYPDKIHLLTRDKKEGLGKAYIDGFQWGLDRGFTYIFQMDADLSHPASSIPFMLETLRKDKDVVVGSRYLSGVNVVNWPLTRIALSLGASFYVRLITGLPVKDPTAGFVGYRASALRKLKLKSINFVGYAFQIEMKFKLWKKGSAIAEIPIVFVNRERGISKMNGSIIWEAVVGVIYLKFISIFSRL